MTRCCFIVVIALYSNVVLAGPTFLPTSEQALAAIDALPAVQAAQFRNAEAEARGEALRRNPYGFELTVMPSVRNEDRGTRYTEWEAQLSHRLRLPRKAALDAQIGDIGRQASTLSFADARHAGARSLLGLWFSWLRMAAVRELAEQQLVIARAETATIERRVVAGDLALLDGERAAAVLAQAEAALARAEADLARTHAALAAQFPTLTLPTVLPDVPVPLATVVLSESEIVQSIVSDNHEIGIAEARARGQGLAAARADAERHPDPSVGLRMLDEARGSEQSFGVVLSIPFAGGSVRPTTEAELSLAEAMAADAASVRGMVQSEARQLAASMPRQLDAWQAARRACDAADAALARMEQAWQLGEAGFSDLALARRTAQDAQALEWQARLDVHETRLRIEVDSHRLWARHDDHEH